MNTVPAFIKKILNLAPKWFLPGILLLNLLIHSPYMKLPAVGNHVWRQVNTLAVARNYAEEDMRIWLPRIDKRYWFSGVTGLSFPAYEYTLAAIYKTVGFAETHHRWLSLIISCFIFWGMYKLAFGYSGSVEFASASTLALLAIPEFYYHSINAVPDILALAFMLWGWVFARKWFQNKTIISWIFAAIFLTLAGLIKLQFLWCGAFLAFEFLNERKYQNKYLLFAGLLLLFCIAVPVLVWYRYANWLTYKDWLVEFVLSVRFPVSLLEFWSIVTKNLFQDVPETWVGYGLLPGFIVGLLSIFRSKAARKLGWVGLAAACCIYLPLQHQFRDHGYYVLAFVPCIAMVAAFGYVKLLKTRYRLLTILLLLAPFTAWARMQRNWQKPHWRVQEEMLTPDFAAKAKKLSDSSVRWIVGPDQTGCVYFYYLHAKGFPWYNENEKLSNFTWFLRKGAKGLITNKPEEFKQLCGDSIVLREAGSVGAFRWYQVKHR